MDMLPLFRPFDQFNFDKNICFLTGRPAEYFLPAFPDWMCERFNLTGKPFKTLDERIISFNEIQVPVSDPVAKRILLLEEEIAEAFLNGYEAVSALDSLKLFQWIALRVYGIIHYEINAGLREQRMRGEDFNFSQSLMRKFGNLHIMLQSLVVPIEFEGVCPWSIKSFRVENEPDTFVYRDEINTLVYSIRLGDFGIIACLQDNQENQEYHKNLLEKHQNASLSPMQFEEICAHFFYSAYLFNRLPEYAVMVAPDTVYLEAMPLHMQSGPTFDNWQNKTYAQVLETFWKPWGHTLFEILKNPDQPMSAFD